MCENEKKSNVYAGVYLLDNPYSIDNIYEYFIPLELRDMICRGAFVGVPFGRGNRKHIAVVWSLSPVANTKHDTKALSYVCYDRPTLNEEAMAICEYMHTYTQCTMGDAVRSVMPATALGKLNEFYRPSDKGRPDRISAGFLPADFFIYDYIAERGSASLESLKAKFGAVQARDAVDKLMQKNYILCERDLSEVSDGVHEYSYRPAVGRERINDILEGRDGIKLRSEAHKRILAFLRDNPEGVNADEIFEACGGGREQLKRLQEKGLVLKDGRRVYRGVQKFEAHTEDFELNAEQAEAYGTIEEYLDSREAHAVLLHGVTGSGKTNVIIKAIDRAISQGRGVIVLIPEIALSPQTVSKFGSRYGERVAQVHSALSAGERYDTYTRIRNGEADIVIGTRSAIFSPVKNLGLIVIDEEHEGTYKSDTAPKYHARDIARFRCAKNGAVMLLASATPSIESYTKAKMGKYTLLKLKERYRAQRLPTVSIYDMRYETQKGNLSPIGGELQEALALTLERGEQAVLFLNRRGYNTMVSCKSCGKPVSCPRCSVAMSYHRIGKYNDDGYLYCHLCGSKRREPSVCAECGAQGSIVKQGFGTQRIEEQLGEMLPNARVLRMDADSVSKKDSHEKMLTAFRRHEYDILLGTQMVTKGHDFPKVTLVGVLLADMSLYLDDYHANERTFSLLTQVIGRAGRGDDEGRAIIQTNNPSNDTIMLACRQNYEEFYEREIRLRKLLTFPPYCDIVLLTLSSQDESNAVRSGKLLYSRLHELAEGRYRDVEMITFGPFEAPVFKVDGKYRMRMVLKLRLNSRSREMILELQKDLSAPKTGLARLSVDFNPSSL